jgi:hypothetical protein
MLSVPRELNEHPVAIGDSSFEVGLGDDEIILPHDPFLPGWHLLVFHALPFSINTA